MALQEFFPVFECEVKDKVNKAATCNNVLYQGWDKMFKRQYK